VTGIRFEGPYRKFRIIIVEGSIIVRKERERLIYLALFIMFNRVKQSPESCIRWGKVHKLVCQTVGREFNPAALTIKLNIR